jgi:hypothetical protein
MTTRETTRQPLPSASWTASRIFKMAVVVTLGVIAALLVTFALLALILA